MTRKVLVTGLLGQDGSNMCEYLLKLDNIKVFGMARRSSNPNFNNCESYLNHPDFQLVYGDLTDQYSIDKLVQEIQPDYFINFAANSFVGISWDMPMQVFDTNAMGVLRWLEAVKRYQPKCRFYSAGSSEEFGDVEYSPQDLNHPLKPRSPYGASKCAARHLVKVFRESYNLYAVHATLFNHEGLKRGEEFVTRKITKGVAKAREEFFDTSKWVDGLPPKVTPIELGNLDAKRDWSDSEDFVEGVWKMLQIDEPRDYLLASGETHSIKEFAERAFFHAGLKNVYWEGEGVDEKLFLDHEGKHQVILVKVNPAFYRPAEVELLWGDPSETQKVLNWRPKISFDKLVERMVLCDIELREQQNGQKHRTQQM